jgi:hypothetical protein
MKTIVVTLLGALALQAQIPKEPAKDLFMHSAKAPGVEIRFVDYHWQPALFEALEKGADIPEAKRNWVVIRMILDDRPLTLEGTRVAVGNYAIALWPNLDGKGMAVEMRRVDMREVYPDINAIGPAPAGETVYKGPAKFVTGNPLVERFNVAVGSEDPAKVTLTVSYGDRRLVLTFVR